MSNWIREKILIILIFILILFGIFTLKIISISYAINSKTDTVYVKKCFKEISLEINSGFDTLIKTKDKEWKLIDSLILYDKK